jgi:hypothetical protein
MLRVADGGRLSGLIGGEALLFEGVAVDVVAVLFPEAGGVLDHEFQAANSSDAFPGAEVGNDQAERVAVVGGQGFAVVFEGEQGGGAHQVG